MDFKGFTCHRSIRIFLLIVVYLSGVLLITGSANTRRHRPRQVRNYTKNLFLDLKSYPSDAAVFLDGREVNKTPCRLKISYNRASRGYHPDQTRTRKLKVEKFGYAPYVLNFSIKGRQYRAIPKLIKMRKKIADAVSITGSAGALKRLTTGGPGERALDFAPDKRWLLIEAFELGKGASANHVLQKIDLHTGTKTVLSPKTSDSRDGAWFPDMKSFVFVSNRLGTRTVVQSLGTSGEVGARFITQPALGAARHPSVDPKGENIAFSIRQSKGQSQLCIIRNDGTNLRVFGAGSHACWRPNGKSIVFVRKVGKYHHLFKMDSVTGADLIELSSLDANDYHPSFSPDGKYIAFISDRVGGRRHLFIMTSNGQRVTQLTDGYFDIDSLTWGEDGYIYFSANAGGNWDIWRLEPKQ
jgi:Tol biopolymer transport system component